MVKLTPPWITPSLILGFTARRQTSASGLSKTVVNVMDRRGSNVRFFVALFLFFCAQTVFALPSATPEQCAVWDEKVTEYTEKKHQTDSLEKQAYYLGKVEEYQQLSLAKRCGPAKEELKGNRLILSDSDQN